jgi:hypothetical protein
MSGGSYNYFYSSGEDMVRTCRYVLDGMSLDCAEIPELCRELGAMATRARNLEADLSRMRELLRTIEWYRSGDYDLDAVREAFAELPPREVP